MRGCSDRKEGDRLPRFVRGREGWDGFLIKKLLLGVTASTPPPNLWRFGSWGSLLVLVTSPLLSNC